MTDTWRRMLAPFTGRTDREQQATREAADWLATMRPTTPAGRPPYPTTTKSEDR